MDIFLEKDILHDISRSSEIEWIEKNDQGFYSSSSCIGMNTRREHGLFVVPDASQKKRVVLLSKLEESIFVNNRLHDISTNLYNTGIYPAGYNYLQKFSMNPFPEYTFEVEGRIIEKTLFLLSNYPLLIIRYELKNKGIPVNIIIKPFIAERYTSEITKDLQGLNTDTYLGNQFVRWAIKPNMPEVYMYFSNGDFNPASLWYKNFVYPNDVGKYDDSLNENLFNPGFFQTTLNSYQSLDLYISTKKLDAHNLDYESFYRNERKLRKSININFDQENNFSRIGRSLRQSVKIIDDKPVVSISALDNIFTTRDIIFSLPGLFLIKKGYNDFKIHFKSLFSQINEGLLPIHSPVAREKNHTSAADLSLWLINLAYTYYRESKDIEFFDNEILDGLQSIYDYYQKGTSHNIYVAKNHLLFTGDSKTSVSWIPLKNDKNEILRYGHLLEINALWYNAIKILAELYLAAGKKRKHAKFTKIAEQTRIAFNEVFINDDGSILDFVVNDQKNNDFRINQIIPLALPFSPLEDMIARMVLKDVENNLLTPYGLKSAKTDKEIKADILHRKSADYYNGAIWPWTISFYIEAALKYSEESRQKAVTLGKYFRSIGSLANNGLINYLPEVVSLNGQPIQKGIADFTPSLSSLIWGFFLLYKEIKTK